MVKEDMQEVGARQDEAFQCTENPLWRQLEEEESQIQLGSKLRWPQSNSLP